MLRASSVTSRVSLDGTAIRGFVVVVVGEGSSDLLPAEEQTMKSTSLSMQRVGELDAD